MKIESTRPEPTHNIILTPDIDISFAEILSDVFGSEPTSIELNFTDEQLRELHKAIGDTLGLGINSISFSEKVNNAILVNNPSWPQVEPTFAPTPIPVSKPKEGDMWCASYYDLTK